ncbi:hypothetical protein ACFLUM_01820 [Chloroflexota bacterium]
MSLIGSLARGEGIWKADDSGPRVLSDLDLIVVTRHHQGVPSVLDDELGRIERESGVAVDVRIAPRVRLPFYPKNVETLDVREHRILLHGPDFTRWLPAVETIDHTNIAYSFFNEVVLSLEELSPSDMQQPGEKSLSLLSHRAAKTLFTCASIVCMLSSRYQSTTAARMGCITADRLGSVKLNGGQFPEDLQSAYAFRHAQPSLHYLPDAEDFFRRARNYLLELFRFYMETQYGLYELDEYPRRAHRSMPARERLRGIYTRFHTVELLLAQGKTPRWSGSISPALCCQMAALMLYLAYDKLVDGMSVAKAEAYLSKFFRRPSAKHDDLPDRWCRARNELKAFHRLGVF